MADFDLLREELRGLDGDLYLCHLFAPADKRDALLVLYHLYADIARIPASVSEPMVGAIRLQWWRDLFSGLAAQETRGTLIGEALLAVQLDTSALMPLIDGREAALADEGRGVEQLENEARETGSALLRVACSIMGQEIDADLCQQAATGFELMRLVPQDGAPVAARATSLLDAACRRFNKLPRTQRKAVLPVFLPIGLARRQAGAYPRQKSLLAYQLTLLRMAFFGKL
jgi:phytoene/squalene synthetase